MSTVSAAAIYARISSDVTGEGLGVERQLQDCRRLAESSGWAVFDEYVDNDISAYSGKPRPAYERMLADIGDGLVDAVLVYNLDRLTRRPMELEEFLALCDRVGLDTVRTVTSDYNIGNDDGLFMARLMAAFAAKESGRKSARMKRKAQQKAEAGQPHKGANRPFGYAEDAVTIVPEEAAIIRDLVARLLAGESLRSLALWLNGEHIPTVTGREWRTTTLRTMLRSPRIAGLREYKGDVMSEAVWPAIISPAQRGQVLAVFEAKKHSGQRTPQRYLLSGMLRCGTCGTRLYSSARRERNGRSARRYVCLSGPDHGGCGRLTVAAEPVEALLTDAVLYRLDTGELADALAGRVAADAEAATLAATLAEDRAQLDELAGMYAARQISSREWLAARGPIEARTERTERRLASMTPDRTLSSLAGTGADLREAWDTMGLDQKVAVMKAILDHADIASQAKRSPRFNPDRVTPVWRH